MLWWRRAYTELRKVHERVVVDYAGKCCEVKGLKEKVKELEGQLERVKEQLEEERGNCERFSKANYALLRKQEAILLERNYLRSRLDEANNKIDALHEWMGEFFTRIKPSVDKIYGAWNGSGPDKPKWPGSEE